MTETNDELMRLCDDILTGGWVSARPSADTCVKLARALRTRLQSVGLTVEEVAVLDEVTEFLGRKYSLACSLNERWAAVKDRLTGLTQRTGVEEAKTLTDSDMKTLRDASNALALSEREHLATRVDAIIARLVVKATPQPATGEERRVLAGGQRDTEDGKPVETRSTDQRPLPSAEVAEIKKRHERDEAEGITTFYHAGTLRQQIHSDRATLLRILGERKVDREKVAQAVCRAHEQNGGLPWEGIDKHNKGLFYDVADAIIAADIFNN